MFMWCCLNEVDSSLPIFSTAPQMTQVYRRRFPARAVDKLYSCADSVIDYAVSLAYSMSWSEALSIARNTDMYFDGYFPDRDGVVFITPDTQHFASNVRYWQAKNPARRVVRTYCAKAERAASIYYFRSIREECEFLGNQSGIVFTKNLVLRQRLNWQSNTFMKFPEWRYTNAMVSQTILKDMSFAEKLEFVAPNKDDVIYKYMARLSKSCATADFFRALEDLLRILENDDCSIYELLFADQDTILGGLEEGDWPEPDSRDGQVMKSLLAKRNVVATSTLDGYGRSRLNCWSSFCTSEYK